MNTKLFWEANPRVGRCKHLGWRGAVFAEALASSVVGKRVLDLGCGGGALAAFLAQQGADVIGLDFSPTVISMARLNFERTARLKFVEADVLNVDLGEQFDVICGRFILHEISYDDTPKLLEFFDSHLKESGFCYFQENSFFNPVSRFVRNRLVGRYGVPKRGSDAETPFDKQRFLLYKRHFKYCERSAEAVSLFQKINAYLIRSKSERVNDVFNQLDRYISTLGIPDIFVRNLSYLQHIYFSNAYPKVEALQ